MRTPASVLADILRSDPARPRVTFYEDTPGPTLGERIELSGKVMGNWVAKAGNALQDEYDMGPGSVVQLSLPPHWRALYWAFAVWSVGATVLCAGGPTAGGPTPDLLICDDPDLATSFAPRSGDVVLVTLAALARVHAGPVPGGVMDEARELASFGDQFSARVDPTAEDLALITDSEHATYGSVVPAHDWQAGARVSLAGDLATVLTSTLATWAIDGSVVLARKGQHAGTEPQPERLAAEGVTLDLA